jgi:hypothetical protein
MFNAIYRLRTGYKKTPECLSSVEPFPHAKDEEEPRTLDARVRHLKKAILILTQNSREDCTHYYPIPGSKFTFQRRDHDVAYWTRPMKIEFSSLLGKHQRLLEEYKDIFGAIGIEEEVEAFMSEDQKTWVVDRNERGFDKTSVRWYLWVKGDENGVVVEKAGYLA